MTKQEKEKAALKILEALNPMYTENSELRTRLVASLAKKLSGNDLSSLWCVILSSKPQRKD